LNRQDAKAWYGRSGFVDQASDAEFDERHVEIDQQAEFVARQF
jgi:hypothetical protein